MKKSYILFATAFLPLFAWADTVQTVTINGKSTDKQVKEISFDGDNVETTFTDGTSESTDLSALSSGETALSIVWNTTNGINKIPTDNTGKTSDAIYNLNGQYLGTDIEKLPKGIYVIKGRKVVKP